MPTISLRLTEEEHADLAEWAHDNKRSIQKEIIYRLFVELPATAIKSEGYGMYGLQAEEPRAAEIVEAVERMGGAPDPHFKPDFGKKL